MKRKADKVAIVGCAETRTQVKRLFGDISEYEIWGLNQLYTVFPEIIPHTSRWFQIHHEDRYMEGDHGTIEWMEKEHPFPIYVREELADKFPSAVAFPQEELVRKFGRYFSSQIAWMMALAIHEGFKEIHLYGIHMAIEDEYYMQKDGVEYYIGLARGMGIRVFVPPECEVLKTAFLYGFEDPSPLLLKLKTDIDDYNSRLMQHNALRKENRDKRVRHQTCLECDCPPDDAKEELRKSLTGLIFEDQELRDRTNQVIGYIEALKYLKSNWIKTGEVRYGKPEDKALNENCNNCGNEGKADERNNYCSFGNTGC
jgi:hypothetical protein